MNGPTKTSYRLEMTSPDDLRPKRGDFPDLRVERMEVKCPEFNKFLHTVVGHQWLWGGRTHWGEYEWRNFVEGEGLETWVAYRSGTPAGYFEIEANPDGNTQIHTFGLLEPFIGTGLGGHLLTIAVECAWNTGAKRVWLSTCSHDHPHALKNYLARGFRIQESRQTPANVPFRSFWEMVKR